MISMRDGVKLHTVIAIPNGIRNAPILLERTPYDASSFFDKSKIHLRDGVFPGDRTWIDAGYIKVAQDVRGKYGSEGIYMMTRPPIGPLNHSDTDDTTDAWDTIDWLSKHVPEANGRVGMIGSSYDGWTVAMALLHPHPALRVAAAESPMIDGWMGDDWFQHGAFRQINLDYFVEQTSHEGHGDPVPRDGQDDYQTFLDAGSPAAYATLHGIDKLPWWNRILAHPSYDAFWQDQALDRLVAAHPSHVPTIWLEGMWDQEDIYGAEHVWEALRAKGLSTDNHLVIGPWYHSQINGRGETLGPLRWRGDTAEDARSRMLLPFFDARLRPGASAFDLPAATIYNPATDSWDHFAEWPRVEKGGLTAFYLQSGFALALDRTKTSDRDDYVSDPAKPVPFEALPVHFGDHPTWSSWLVQDQRFVATRPDVLSYETPRLTRPLRLSGAPEADLFAATSGTDADFVVKIIDVYPADDADQPTTSGYELPLSLSIFRGRYRAGFDRPSPIPADITQEYRFRLPIINDTILPGHRLMVQIQSTLFPLYDRNPQVFLTNPLTATSTDYRKASVSILHGGNTASAVLLPVVQNLPNAR